jgi:hypothetical protein
MIFKEKSAGILNAGFDASNSSNGVITIAPKVAAVDKNFLRSKLMCF